MRSGQAEAVLVLASTMFQSHWPDLAERTVTGRLAAMGERRAFAAAGGLLSHGPSAATRRARAVGQMGDLVRRLKREPLSEAAAAPAAPMELVVNLKTAHVLGLTIPPAVLARADAVIPSPRSAIASKRPR
jgi:putative ABC transport system substrate-binding protein